jgi:hypothetical protein
MLYALMHKGQHKASWHLHDKSDQSIINPIKSPGTSA